jgi:hypothetical protein
MPGAVFAAAIPVLAAAAAHADTLPAGLITCQGQTDAKARLACYDHEMGKLHPVADVAPAAPPASAATMPEPAKVPAATPVAIASAAPAEQPAAAVPSDTPAPSAEERFGLNSAQLAQKSAPPPPELADVNAHVVRVSPAAAGGVVLDLDNGQRWRQTSLDQDLMLKPGDPVHIRRGVFGSFTLGAPNGRFARVARLN